MSLLHKADSLNSNGSLNGGEASPIVTYSRRELEAILPGRDLVRNALIGAGFSDVVIEADIPQIQSEAPVEVQPQQQPTPTANILSDAVDFVSAPYLQDQLQDNLEALQEVPVAQAVMFQTVRNPELN